eukprot:TRINITY_DN49_c2_g1_i1.p1 TRINITY_DN49_c2_g1~~TRINITY_DN49_c2_g1_i1.p1  ORF type:complete len:264 (+),score=53.38 TRINITY_DN49_c2_g1_i1:25-792(+)
MSLTELSQHVIQFREAVESEQPNAPELFEEIKIELLLFAPNGEEERKQHKLASREVYEWGVLLALKLKDLEQFSKNISQVLVFYHDGSLGDSESKYNIWGLYLLHLLVDNKLSQFHSQLELLPVKGRDHNSVKFVISLEQYLMEGAHNKVMEAKNHVPGPYYEVFVDAMIAAVREEIASCTETSYSKLSVQRAISMMLFTSENELASFVAENRPTWEVRDNVIYFVKEDVEDKKIPADELVSSMLGYAADMEQVI